MEFEKLRRIIAEVLNINPDDIRPDSAIMALSRI